VQKQYTKKEEERKEQNTFWMDKFIELMQKTLLKSPKTPCFASLSLLH